MPLERIPIHRFLSGESLGNYCGVWIHEILHGLPSLLFIGPWGFGKEGSGIPIAIPHPPGAFGFFIPNPAMWGKYLKSLSAVEGAIFILLTFLAPYFVHLTCFCIDRMFIGKDRRTKSNLFLHNLWEALAEMHSGMAYDLACAALCVIVLFCIT